eukprot:TRINITY_DN8872_c0_g2_i1.p1 TRINITY_DN8872_c0_g2~~TRINITY_DN8872_c0_g2_i1.p1  ORF type:complete len:205 (+),score=-16.71 TRINITY_DN8872_c0_g2_i1:131-745(+)
MTKYYFHLNNFIIYNPMYFPAFININIFNIFLFNLFYFQIFSGLIFLLYSFQRDLTFGVQFLQKTNLKLIIIVYDNYHYTLCEMKYNNFLSTKCRNQLLQCWCYLLPRKLVNLNFCICKQCIKLSISIKFTFCQRIRQKDANKVQPQLFQLQVLQLLTGYSSNETKLIIQSEFCIKLILFLSGNHFLGYENVWQFQLQQDSLQV